MNFIEPIDRKNEPLIVDIDVAMAMAAYGRNIENKPNWLVLDKEVKFINRTRGIYCIPNFLRNG